MCSDVSPRWTSSEAGQGANWPHDGDGALTVESDFLDEVKSRKSRDD